MKKILFLLGAVFVLSACANSTQYKKGNAYPPQLIVHKDLGFFDLLFQSDAVNVTCKRELINFNPNYRSYDQSVYSTVRNARRIVIIESQTGQHNKVETTKAWLKQNGARVEIENGTQARCDGNDCTVTICFD
ncbi:lipoprotein [Providencia alcalifaciens]|uniref:lipoprotein n=1 Tax=Providencia alcalifaciens TaxID=126385 RepID=UPI001CC4902E|nr:lipoprotein [Providencia alcalifaciens]CAG9416781.1 hypothetical protein NVI2019_GHJFPKLH_01428 [Providencia alcalifaciens]